MPGFTATEGGYTQRVELARAAALFAPQPLVTDGWQAAAFDFSRGPGRQRLDSCTNSSSRPDRGSGPMLGVVFKDKEFLGEREVEVAASRFRARRRRIHPLMGAWLPGRRPSSGFGVRIVFCSGCAGSSSKAPTNS